MNQISIKNIIIGVTVSVVGFGLYLLFSYLNLLFAGAV